MNGAHSVWCIDVMCSYSYERSDLQYGNGILYTGIGNVGYIHIPIDIMGGEWT